MNRDALLETYHSVRARTEALCKPLAVEDHVAQSMPDASPVKWHLAHTSWFFETFVLLPLSSEYRAFDEHYRYLFNSYYVGVGARHPRPERGLLSRPTVAEVYDYRRHVDGGVGAFFENAPEDLFERCAEILEVGVNHEEQHQELLLTDVKHLLALNPLQPVYRERPVRSAAARAGSAREVRDRRGPAAGWIAHPAGVVEIGHAGEGFSYDNERPRHRVYLEAFELADRLVTCGEYLEFIEDRGYERPELWLSDGWAARDAQAWTAPLYWRREESPWLHSTLAGPQEIDMREPVCHVSYYEAEAFARWEGARLPREEEWEAASAGVVVRGNLVEGGALHPMPLAEPPPKDTPAQLFGDVWEWTASPYVSYPGFTPFEGALGEYNGKFMCNQMVLRGGSCATPARHIRPTYRNFFPPQARWQFSGIRLAR